MKIMKSLLKASVLIVGLINNVSAQGAGGEASVGGSDNAGPSGSASGSASIDCDPVSDGLPSCTCLSGSISGSAEGSSDGDAGGSASLSVDPGVNCIDDAEGDEPGDFITYETDIERNSMMIQYNNYVKLQDVVQADANITYMKDINKDEAFRIYMAQITIKWQPVWKWEENGKSMKNACDDSFPEGTVEYLMYDILNKMLYNEQGCNIEAGSVFIMPPWLRSYPIKLQNQIPCGDYSFDIWLQTPIGSSAGRIWFDWTIPEGSNCLPEIGPIQ